VPGEIRRRRGIGEGAEPPGELPEVGVHGGLESGGFEAGTPTDLDEALYEVALHSPAKDAGGDRLLLVGREQAGGKVVQEPSDQVRIRSNPGGGLHLEQPLIREEGSQQRTLSRLDADDGRGGKPSLESWREEERRRREGMIHKEADGL